MRIAIINNARPSANEKIKNAFCGKYVPYKINNIEEIEDKKHIGIVIIDKDNPELINKIINLIKNESR
tara:strand:+ start:1474 stop:1677 length:204 start_codon:yes stop_codon:yes gene_type:complete